MCLGGFGIQGKIFYLTAVTESLSLRVSLSDLFNHAYLYLLHAFIFVGYSVKLYSTFGFGGVIRNDFIPS